MGGEIGRVGVGAVGGVWALRSCCGPLALALVLVHLALVLVLALVPGASSEQGRADCPSNSWTAFWYHRMGEGVGGWVSG